MRKLYYISISIVLALVCLVGSLMPTKQSFAVKAELVDYENTYVLDDLKNTMISGKMFNTMHYPKNSSGQLKVLVLSEYCYSYYLSDMINYGLYIYVYNPAQLNINTNSVLNKIQLGVEFGEDEISATKYAKFGLSLRSSTTDKLFYKFKVIDSAMTVATAVRNYAKTNNGVRPYSCGEVELLITDNQNATPYTVGTTYKYSGYAEGYGGLDNSALDLKLDVLETLELEVHSTFYRPEGEAVKGSHLQDQLTSVYFAVPNRVLDIYGEFYAANVEWYEYLTKEILVTGHTAAYSNFKNYIGQSISAYDENVYYGFASNYRNVSGGAGIYFDLGDVVYNSDVVFPSDKELDVLYYLFSSGGMAASDFTVSSQELTDYIKNYSDEHSSYEIQGKFSGDLFYDYVGAGRIVGYNNHSVQKDDEFSLNDTLVSQKWWQKLLGMASYDSTTYDGIKGIQDIKWSNYSGLSKANVCSNLYINSGDYEHFKNFCISSEADGKTVFLLRFAVTDYYSAPAHIIRDTYSWNGGYDFETVSTNAYLAQQTVFLDFDVIDVTFHKDGVFTVIPVAASPIDIIADITSPVKYPLGSNFNLWGFLLLIVFFLVLFFIKPLFEFVLWLLSMLVNIISFPIRIIKKIFKKT